jgi:hypothetical protein
MATINEDASTVGSLDGEETVTRTTISAPICTTMKAHVLAPTIQTQREVATDEHGEVSGNYSQTKDVYLAAFGIGAPLQVATPWPRVAV